MRYRDAQPRHHGIPRRACAPRMDHVLYVGLHGQPRAELRQVGELHAGLPGGGASCRRLRALVVRSIPRGRHCQPQRVLRTTQSGGYLGGGFTLTAPFSSRAQDGLGLAVAAARNGSHYERAQTAAGGTAAGETSVELTYLAQLGSWLTVQPDVQYVIHPGGTRATRNAVVPGLRVAVSH